MWLGTRQSLWEWWDDNMFQELHKLWSKPNIQCLISDISEKVSLAQKKGKRVLLSKEETDLLNNIFKKTLSALKQRISKLIKNKLSPEEGTQWLDKRFNHYLNWVINNIKWYNSQYFVWNILFKIKYSWYKKFWDFPWEYSLQKFYEWCIAELTLMPNILKNPEENRLKLKRKISWLRKQILELSVKKLGKKNGPMWWFKDKIEELEKKLVENFWEDRRKYYSWHAFAGSTPWKDGPHIYKDFPWENSVVVFMKNCILELKSMPDLVSK